MIQQRYMGKTIQLTDVAGKVWEGKVTQITSMADSDSGENELAIAFSGRLTEFKESEIATIQEI